MYPEVVSPYFAEGMVVAGFGRGSKELGIPTANFPDSVVANLPDTMKTGVYYGYASVDMSPVYKMVMSVGWNPFYKNVKKSMEIHILHKFDQDLYGKNLKVIILGYIREELQFDGVENLIKKINEDIAVAEEVLDKEGFSVFRNHSFLVEE